MTVYFSCVIKEETVKNHKWLLIIQADFIFVYFQYNTQF